MSEIALRAQHLGKQYKIGADRTAAIPPSVTS